MTAQTPNSREPEVSTHEARRGDIAHHDRQDHRLHRAPNPAADLRPPSRRRGGWAGVRDALGATVGAALGLLPHLLHHVSLFAGALMITGAAGNLLFGTLGLLLSLPLLRRLYRRFGSWKAPALALAGFTALFSLSAFVIGPALAAAESGRTPTAPSSDIPGPGTPSPSAGHDAHHGD